MTYSVMYVCLESTDLIPFLNDSSLPSEKANMEAFWTDACMIV